MEAAIQKLTVSFDGDHGDKHESKRQGLDVELHGVLFKDFEECAKRVDFRVKKIIR
jgi:hypothetical protein